MNCNISTPQTQINHIRVWRFNWGLLFAKRGSSEIDRYMCKWWLQAACNWLNGFNNKDFSHKKTDNTKITKKSNPGKHRRKRGEEEKCEQMVKWSIRVRHDLKMNRRLAFLPGRDPKDRHWGALDCGWMELNKCCIDLLLDVFDVQAARCEMYDNIWDTCVNNDHR